MKKIILLIFLLFPFLSISQRNIPYPIILVHGLTGGSTTWSDFNIFLSSAGLSIESQSMNYCLNSDGRNDLSIKSNDVSPFGTWSISNKDVYTINFNTCSYSNQSAIVKQGFALNNAIARVLYATGADKVILLGHSMGGLAIREYLQNSENWQSDGNHHVAKVVTVGTPHGGSDLGSGGLNLGLLLNKPDENSEAVRDLKNSYASSDYYSTGVYLFGGKETKSTITTDIFGNSKFYNIDINCNGQSGDNIVGLNRKSMPGGLPFSFVLGKGVVSLSGYDNTGSDGVVTYKSQNLNNFYALNGETFSFQCNNSTDYKCHEREPHSALFQMFYALDEPSYTPHYFNVELNKTYTGFFTNQQDGSYSDIDAYTLFVPKKGKLTVNANIHAQANGQFILMGANGEELYRQYGTLINKEIEATQGGNYTLIFQGNSGNGYRGYNYNVSFCEYPERPLIYFSTPTTNICEGTTTNLSTSANFNVYRWYKDGFIFSTLKNEIIVSTAGKYDLVTSKCGTDFYANNSIKISTTPKPTKPEIQFEDKPLQFTLKSNSTNSLGWYLNGLPIIKAVANAYVPTSFGNYTVLAINACGTTMSDAFVIPEAPKITLSKNEICVGDSVTIKANLNLNTYRWYRDTTKLVDFKPEITTKVPGNYKAVIQVGKGVSIPSAAVVVKVNPIPEKPIISLLDNLEVPTLKSSYIVGNQWYSSGSPIAQATDGVLRNLSFGDYTVKVNQLGCFNTSEVYKIKGLDDFAFSEKVKVYPNPGVGNLKIELPFSNITNLTIYGMNGIEYLSDEVKNFNRGKELNLNLVSGSYILRIVADGREVIKRIVIER